jgi:hypothetical protein
MLCARPGRRPGWSGTEAGAQARPGAGPRAGSGASRLEPVETVVTQSVAWVSWGSDDFQDGPDFSEEAAREMPGAQVALVERTAVGE